MDPGWLLSQAYSPNRPGWLLCEADSFNVGLLLIFRLIIRRRLNNCLKYVLIICFNKKQSKFRNICVDFWEKKKSLELTRVGQTHVYLIFRADSHTFSTCRGGSTQVSKRVTRQDGFTRVTCKQFDWKSVDPGWQPTWFHVNGPLVNSAYSKNL